MIIFTAGLCWGLALTVGGAAMLLDILTLALERTP